MIAKPTTLTGSRAPLVCALVGAGGLVGQGLCETGAKSAFWLKENGSPGCCPSLVRQCRPMAKRSAKKASRSQTSRLVNFR